MLNFLNSSKIKKTIKNALKIAIFMIEDKYARRKYLDLCILWEECFKILKKMTTLRKMIKN